MSYFYVFPLLLMCFSILKTNGQTCSENWDSFIVKDGNTVLLNVDKATKTTTISKLSIGSGSTIIDPKAKIEALEQRVTTLESENSALKQQVNNLVKRVDVSNTNTGTTVTAKCSNTGFATKCVNSSSGFQNKAGRTANIVGNMCTCRHSYQTSDNTNYYNLKAGDCTISCVNVG